MGDLRAATQAEATGTTTSSGSKSQMSCKLPPSMIKSGGKNVSQLVFRPLQNEFLT